MANNQTKKFNIHTLLLVVSAALLVFSVVAYFLPFVIYAPNHLSYQTTFSGYDFTRVLAGKASVEDSEILIDLFAGDRTMQYAQAIAYMAPISAGCSVVIFVFTILALFFPKFNNIFAIGGMLAVWIVLGISVVGIVGSMAVTNGAYVFNSYAIGWGLIGGIMAAIVSAVINIISNLTSN